MRVLAVAVGVVLFAAGDAVAQQECRLVYYGEYHTGDWTYLTIDANSRGPLASSGITIYDEPTQVCGHNGVRAEDGWYCGTPGDFEWLLVSACGNAQVVLSADPAMVGEGAGATGITVTGRLTGALSNSTTVSVSVGAGGDSATEGTDYTTVNDFTLTIGAGQMKGTRTFNLVPIDDAAVEGDEMLTVSGSTTDRPVHSATVTITDNDTAGVTVSPTALTVTEGSSDSYTVVLTSQPNGNVTVAVGGASGDVSVDKETLTFTTNNWNDAQRVTVRAGEDNDAETDPQVTLTHTVSGGGYSAVTASAVTVDVTENDTASTKVTLSVNPSTVDENDGSTQVTVTGTLDGVALTTAMSVEVTVGAGADSATEGTDYTTVSDFTLTIAADARSGSATFTLTPKDDAFEEDNETLVVSGTTSDLTVDSTTMTIKDDDGAAVSTKVTLSVEPDEVSEGAGPTAVTVTGELDGAVLSRAVTVSVSVAGGTATAGEDFAAVSDFTLTIAADARSGSATFTLTPKDDAFEEDNETLVVSGTTVDDLTVDSTTMTIKDDDGAAVSTKVTLSVEPDEVSEGAGPTAVTVTGELDGAVLSRAVTVSVSVAGGTATAGEDFAAVADFTLTIAADARSGSATFTLTPKDDAFEEDNETLVVSGTTSDLTVDSTTMTIKDDDGAAVSTKVTLSVEPDEVSEGAGPTAVTVTGELDGAVLSRAVTVSVSVAGGTATAGEDFAAVADFTLTIAADARSGSATFTLTPKDDAFEEDNETLVVSGTTSDLTVDSTTMTIKDDDGAAVSTKVTLSVEPDEVSEGAGPTAVTVTGELDGAVLSRAVTVSVSVAGGTATAGEDFAAVADFTLTIAADARSGSATFTLTPKDDAFEEDNETLVVSGTTSDLTVDSTTMTIKDDDGAAVSTKVTLSVEPDEVSEGAGPTAVTVTGELDGAVLSRAATVTVSVAGGTATAGEDFAAVADFTLTIAADARSGSATFTLTPKDDAFEEDNETLVVSGTTSDLTVDSTTMTIKDDDGAAVSTKVTLSVEPDEVSEGAGPTAVTVTGELDGAVLSRAATVTVSVAGGTATAGEDFAAVSDFTLTIAADARSGSATFTLTPKDDAFEEDNETLVVSGTTSDLTVDSTTMTIKDDDGAAVSTKVTLSVEPDEVSEGAGPTAVTVTGELDGAVLSRAATVTVSVAGGTATAGEDFAAVSDFTLTIAADARSGSATFTLTPKDDAFEEDNETLVVSGTTSDLTVDSTTMTIKDDDGAAVSTKVTLSVEPDEVSEGAGPTAVTVTGELDGAVLSRAATVTVSVAGGTATAGEDFAAVSDFTLTIAADARSGSATFTLTPKDDAFEEDNETLVVSGTTSDLTVDSTTMTIKDDDGAAVSTKVTLSVEPDEVSEGAGPTAVTVTGELDGAVLSRAVTVSVSVAGGTATAGEDFAAVADFTLTIAENGKSGSATFNLSPNDDGVVEEAETLTVSGTAEGLTVDSATVTITDDDEDTPGPPTFGSARYTFTLPENRDGRETPVHLGVVAAQDPDEQPLTYTLSAGDATRFRVAASNGAVTYVGPGEDLEAGTPRYELTVTARDTERLTASTAVEVIVTDVPEAPVASDDAAETPEDEPVVLDVLSNDRDPDGDRLRVMAVTAPEHGTASVVSGGVQYTPSLNYHGPDLFRYTVADPGGLTATATVKVKVTPVNDPPEAVDDEAETLEDEPVVVDVLANDTDEAGDPLRVVAATAPAHGTTTVESGGVRYSPALNYHGLDRFSYTVADPGGLTDTATVTLTVWPVSDAPEAVGVIPDQALEEGGESVTVNLTPYYTDVDGDALTYTAESSNPAATVVAVSSSTLTLSAVVRGAATVTVTATDPEGLTATHVFGVSVGDMLVREVLTDTLAALGRGHLSSVRQTVGRRLETGGTDQQRLMVAGQSFGPGSWDRMGVGGLAQTHELLFRAAMLQQRGGASDMVGTSADPRLREPSSFGGLGSFGGDWERALPSTDVLMAFGGAGAADDDAAGGRPRWTVWGQGDLQTFRGTPSEVKGYDGELRTGYLGIDAQLTRRWMLGVAMARSGGSSAWERGGSAGELSTSLTRVHPYVRWANEDTAVWGVLGAGRGTATHVRTLTGLQEASPLRLGLGLLEGRRRVATVGGGLEIGVRGEASWAHLSTGGGDETIDDLDAGVRRVRGGVEVTRAVSGPGGLTLTPFGAVSTRHDGGAGQTGVGLEVAGGVRLRGGRLQVEAQGRRLVLHSATAYEEQGVSVAASVGAGPYEPGLTLSLRPTWGAPGTGAETLWQDQMHSYVPGSGYGQSGIDAQLGYGMRLPGGSLLTPFGSYGQRENSGRRLQVGALLGSLGQVPGAFDGPMQLKVSGERYERPGGVTDHRFSIFGVLNLGSGSGARRNAPR